LGGALQPLDGLLVVHFFGGMVESPDKLFRKLFVDKVERKNPLGGVARQARG
jgi:hypothetical protein